MVSDEESHNRHLEPYPSPSLPTTTCCRRLLPIRATISDAERAGEADRRRHTTPQSRDCRKSNHHYPPTFCHCFRSYPKPPPSPSLLLYLLPGADRSRDYREGEKCVRELWNDAGRRFLRRNQKLSDGSFRCKLIRFLNRLIVFTAF
ncbi:hypothetical protein LXL04_020532 [Taraxacum kok-saghyz]